MSKLREKHFLRNVIGDLFNEQHLVDLLQTSWQDPEGYAQMSKPNAKQVFRNVIGKIFNEQNLTDFLQIFWQMIEGGAQKEADKLLLDSIEAKNPDKIKLAITYKADVNFRGSQYTALDLAGHQGVTELMEILIENGAKVHIPRIFQLAAQHGNLKLSQLLLITTKKEYAYKADSKGKTPLHLASENGREEVVQLLLSIGAVVNARDKEGKTPLFLSAFNKCSQVTKLLIANKGDLSINDNYDRSPLRWIDSGRNQEIKDLCKLTPEERVASLQEYVIKASAIEPLVLAGADSHEPQE